MAGRLITVVGKTTFTLNFAATGNALSNLGSRTYDARDAVSGVVLARVSSCTGIPTGGSISIGMVNALSMPDDPGTLYTLASAGQIAGVSIAATDTGFPRLYVAGFTASSSPPCGPQVGFGMQAVYGSAAGTATIVLALDWLIRDT